MFYHLDCRHFLGDRPCRFRRPCAECPHYAPMGPRVLIIKLGALGDVVRTAALLPGLAAGWPEPPHVTWLTAPVARPLVERMPGVDRVLTFEAPALAQLAVEQFDAVLCLEKEPAPCAVAMRVRAERRLGFGLSRYGTIQPLSEESEYLFRLGLDDEEKFHVNQKSYPHLVYEALGLEYAGQRYALEPTGADQAAADALLAAAGLAPGRALIGLNPGAGAIFANKAWGEAQYLELIRQMSAAPEADAPRAEFLLLGGADEQPLLARLAAAGAGLPLHTVGAGHALGTFTALVGRCAVLVAGDTLAMHLAVAQERRVVALFGPTCAQEIDLFGRGEKIITTAPCAPCYRRACDRRPTCQELIGVETVLAALRRQWQAALSESAAAPATAPPPAVSP